MAEQVTKSTLWSLDISKSLRLYLLSFLYYQKIISIGFHIAKPHLEPWNLYQKYRIWQSSRTQTLKTMIKLFSLSQTYVPEHSNILNARNQKPYATSSVYTLLLFGRIPLFRIL